MGRKEDTNELLYICFPVYTLQSQVLELSNAKDFSVIKKWFHKLQKYTYQKRDQSLVYVALPLTFNETISRTSLAVIAFEMYPVFWKTS